MPSNELLVISSGLEVDQFISISFVSRYNRKEICHRQPLPLILADDISHDTIYDLLVRMDVSSFLDPYEFNVQIEIWWILHRLDARTMKKCLPSLWAIWPLNDLDPSMITVKQNFFFLSPFIWSWCGCLKMSDALSNVSRSSGVKDIVKVEYTTSYFSNGAGCWADRNVWNICFQMYQPILKCI